MIIVNLDIMMARRKISLGELAEKIDVSRQTLSKYETGESLPDVEKSRLIAEVFAEGKACVWNGEGR